MNTLLFRPEVLAAKKNPQYGMILINTPYSYIIITVGLIGIIILIVLFVVLADFSQKFIVQGYLNPTQNVVKVFAVRPGIISRKITASNNVKKGQPLFEIDTSFDHSERDILLNLQNKKAILADALARHKNQLHVLKKLVNQKFLSLTTYQESYKEFLVLKNNLNAAEMELLRYQHDRSYIIYSPIDGKIVNVMGQVGQFINGTKPLLKIIPANAHLRAELFVPVSQAGFLTKKQQVLLRYDAYPYEQFGVGYAQITHIDQNILIDGEEDKPLRIGQPYYRVLANLEKQFITLDNKVKKIQSGMTFSAVIVGPKRKIWQWLFLPLINYTQNV